MNTNGIKIRELRREDIAKVLNLLNLAFSGQGYFCTEITNKWWQWRYERSPFGEPIHLIAEDDNSQQIVGFRSFWPWKLKLGDYELKAFQPQATAVHPSFRRMGIFRNMNFVALQQAIKEKTDILFNFPNSSSMPGNLSMGWKFVSKIPWQVKPLKPTAILRSLFSTKKAFPLEIKPELQLKEEHFPYLKDPEIYKELIRTNVSTTFLKWRYINHPFFHYGFHAVSMGTKWMSGVFSVIQKGNRKEMYLVDIFGHQECLPSFFRQLTAIARTMDVTLIAAIQTTGYGMENLWKLGFLKYRHKNMVALALNPSLEERARELNYWKLVGGMHDTL